MSKTLSKTNQEHCKVTVARTTASKNAMAAGLKQIETGLEVIRFAEISYTINQLLNSDLFQNFKKLQFSKFSRSIQPASGNCERCH